MRPSRSSALFTRRHALHLVGAALLVACKRGPGEERCKACGMKLDAASPWRAELLSGGVVVAAFDSPRCAFAAWRGGKVAADALRVREYYEHAVVDASAVRFVVGSNVLGPMGPDLVPVAPERASKFLSDHEGERIVTVSEVDLAMIDALH